MKKKEWMLGLRAVTTRSLGQLLEQEAVVQGGQEPGHGVQGDQVYSTGDISSVVHLVTHHHTWDWSTLAYKVNMDNVVSSRSVTFIFFPCRPSSRSFSSDVFKGRIILNNTNPQTEV